MDSLAFPQDDNAPMTLQEACRIVFRDAIKPATLRAEAMRGRLVIERIGRRDFVTMAALNDMREKCRVRPLEREHGSAHPRSSTSSLADRAEAARAAALESALALRKNHRKTKARNAPTGKL